VGSDTPGRGYGLVVSGCLSRFAAWLSMRVVWVLTCSGLAYRVLASAMRGTPLIVERSRFALKSETAVVGWWMSSFAMLQWIDGPGAVPELVGVTVLLAGSRIAGVDAWFGYRRNLGDYFCGLRKPISVTLILGVLVLNVVLQMLSRSLSISALGELDVNEGQVGRAMWFSVAFFVAVWPAALVAELIAGIARKDRELAVALEEQARATEVRRVDELMHTGALAHLANVKLAAEYGEHLLMMKNLRRLEDALLAIRTKVSARQGEVTIGNVVRRAELLTDNTQRNLYLSPSGVGGQLLPGDVALEVEGALLVLVQTAITAGAHDIHLEMSVHNTSLPLRVWDSGRGYRPEVALSEGRGLFGLARRLNEVGGSLSVKEGPPTVASCRIPSPLAKSPVEMAS